MNEALKAKCELFAENYTEIHNAYKWELDIMNFVAASVYTGSDLKVDIDKMKQCREIIRKKQGILSDLRGAVELALQARMAVSNAPENYLDEVIGVYDKVKKGKIFTNEYMVLSALLICEQHKVGQAEEIVKKTKRILKLMEKKHPILTGNEDMPFATIMAMMPDEEEKMIAEMEECFDILTKKFPFHKDAVQGLCQVLTLCGMSGEDKCKKASDIFDALKKHGVKYGKSTELAALGALVDLDLDAEQIAEAIDEASDFLKKTKGFGNFNLGKEYRAMFAALLVAEVYSAKRPGRVPDGFGSSLAFMIAEEIVLMILVSIMATTAAANTASHS